MTYKEIRSQIIDTMNLPDQLEPHFQLGYDYNKLTNEIDQELFIKAIKDFLIQGSIYQRFCCLVSLEIMGRILDCKTEIKSCVENFNIEIEMKLISRLLFACAEISEDWSLDFIRDIIIVFRHKEDRYFTKSLSIRCLALSARWEELVAEMNESYVCFSDRVFIDELAFFKFKRGDTDYKKLTNKFVKDNFERLMLLEDLIEARLLNYSVDPK